MGQTVGILIKRKLEKHFSALKQNRKEQERQWNKEKQQLLARCLFSVNHLKGLLEKAQETLKPIFTDITCKDELFKFFYGHHYRLGKFFLLPIFSEANESAELRFDSERGVILAFAWNICTGMLTFKIIENVSDGGGIGEAVQDNFFSKKDIQKIPGIFLDSDRAAKPQLEECIVEWNTSEYARFVDKLTRIDFLSDGDSFLNRIINLYGSEVTKREVKKLQYSKRCNEIITFGSGKKFKSLSPSVVGEDKDTMRNVEEMMELLSDEGYPDRQKAIVDIQDYFFEKDDKPKYKTVSIGSLREEFLTWTKYKGSFADECSNYKKYFILND